jgi:hypothetical protein
MSEILSSVADWSPEQIEQTRRWIDTWRTAGMELEKIRRREIRKLNTYHTIELLCGAADYTRPPRAPKPSSGLVEQQRLFMKALNRE